MDTTMERRRISWKLPHVTADGLKMFACITMLVQTIGIAIVEKGMIHLDKYTQAGLSEALSGNSRMMFLAGIGSGMQLIGGFAVPIFAFLLVEGFLKTSSYHKYLLSMVLFALISEIPYDLAMSQKFFDWSSQNALITMSLCLLMLYFLQMIKGKRGAFSIVAQIAIVVCAVVWAFLFRADYGLCMVLLTAIFYLFHDRNVLKTVLGILVSLMYVTGPLAFYGLWCYNEERKDKLPKYVYYLFYPVHLLVLGVIAKYYMGA
jgi:heme/copper-type cytochrome/quinol oxidase subunit 4